MHILYFTSLSDIDTLQQLIVARFARLQLQTHPIPPKTHPLILSHGSLLLHEPNAISFHLSQGSKLLSQDLDEEASMYSWLEFFNIQVHPLLQQLYGQIFGAIAPERNKFAYALDELKKALKVLDEQLKSRTYLVADCVSLADLIISCQLDRAFRLVLPQDLRKKLPNLTRWYRHLRSMEPFVNVLGRSFLCGARAFEPAFVPQAQKAQTAEKVEKVETNKEADKKESISQVDRQKLEEKVGSQEEKIGSQEEKIGSQEEKVGSQEENKEDQNKKWSIDQFKRKFQNEPEKEGVIEELASNFPEGWSIWKIYYNKDVTEGKVDYVTANMCRGNVLRLESLRKNAFGNLGVYYSEESQQYEIRGVMLWKGEEVAPEWKEQQSYEYHTFSRLDPADKNDLGVIKEYWASQTGAEGLSLYDSFKLI